MLIVGRIFFVNGLIGGGSPDAGMDYWNHNSPGGSPFVNAAKGVFTSRPGGTYHEPTTFYTKYTFHPVRNHLDADYRRRRGHENAGTHASALTQYLDPRHHSLVFVTHSMGAAYAEGMMEKLKEDGWFVHAAVHLNPFQPAYIRRSAPFSRTIHYQNPDDPVTREVLRDHGVLAGILEPELIPYLAVESGVKGPGRIDGAIYVEYESGLRPEFVHASPEGDPETWTRIKQADPGL
jgi:hypothetical protein